VEDLNQKLIILDPCPWGQVITDPAGSGSETLITNKRSAKIFTDI